MSVDGEEKMSNDWEYLLFLKKEKGRWILIDDKALFKVNINFFACQDKL